jgi:SAM-dependent methyltransferase
VDACRVNVVEIEPLERGFGRPAVGNWSEERRVTSRINEEVSSHYGWSGLMATIEEEIRRNGIDPASVTVDELAPVDNYHSNRLAGTLVLARAAGITAADRVLDVGGGIGGPARQLARRYGCHVTVVDLTAEYCAAGETLTGWTNLQDNVSFVCADALAMPFDDGSFDVVWTQHASMNIADKAGLYREIARVIRVSGRFAFFDILAGPNQPIHVPVPWASDPSFSFLATPDETRALIADAGFRETTWLIGEALDAELDRPEPERDGPAPRAALNPGLLNGPNGPVMRANLARNRQEGRIVPALGAYVRI